MLAGKVKKIDGRWWYAECRAIGAVTQGRSRKDARAMLADCIETLVGRAGFTVRVTDVGPDGSGSYAVLVDSDLPEVLASEVLKHQRLAHRLTLQDVAKKLGTSNSSAYAAYEKGKRAPSISKFRELLAAVAPEMMITVGPRTTAKTKRALR